MATEQYGLNEFDQLLPPEDSEDLYHKQCDYHSGRRVGRIDWPVIEYSDGSVACFECHSQNRRGHNETHYG